MVIPYLVDSPIYIIGPKSVTEHYSPDFEKTVYIFGDYHKNHQRPCGDKQPQITIHDLLVDWIHQEKVSNIFIETITPNPNTSRPLFEQVKQLLGIFQTGVADSYLSRTVDTLKNLSQEELKQTRVHYTDIRESCLHFSLSHSQRNGICMIRDLLDALSLIVFHTHSDKFSIFSEWLNQETVKHILHQLFDKSKVALDQDLAIFESQSGILKELQKLPEGKIQHFFNQKLREARRLTHRRMIRLKQAFTRIKDYNAVRNFIIDYYGDFLIEYMDLYLLTRVFQNLLKKSQKSIVIYAGHIHAEQYRKVLKHFGFKTRRTIKNGDNKMCVRL
jgi:hypothetical protein